MDDPIVAISIVLLILIGIVGLTISLCFILDWYEEKQANDAAIRKDVLIEESERKTNKSKPFQVDENKPAISIRTVTASQPESINKPNYAEDLEPRIESTTEVPQTLITKEEPKLPVPELKIASSAPACTSTWSAVICSYNAATA